MCFEVRGIYVHVPFCKSRCIYCDFYSSTCGLREQRLFLEALENEVMEASAEFPQWGEVDSIYIGGGTPSVLSEEYLERLFDILFSRFGLSKGAEFTVELNPNDVSKGLAELLSRKLVNRVSMGAQTFNGSLLKFLGRRHSEEDVFRAVDLLRCAGIDNISIDLIYSLPEESLELWQEDLDKAFRLPISHLSAYSLMFEEGTRLFNMLERGEVKEADELLCLEMYRMLCRRAKDEGFEHYEISNFCRPNFQARHNSGYWQDMLYLGFGPGAHSYDGRRRWSNKPDLGAYICSKGRVRECNLREVEVLTDEILREEMIMKSLRTAKGLNLREFALRFGEKRCERLLNRAFPYINNGSLERRGERLVLSEEGIFISNEIISSLF